jgi:hypothetical protein
MMALGMGMGVVNVAHAHTYQFESTLSYWQYDIANIEFNYGMGEFIYFLKPVDTAGLPIKEAYYLTQSSYLGARYYRDPDDSDLDGYTVGGSFWDGDFRLSLWGGDDFGDERYQADIGYQILKGLTLDLGVSKMEISSQEQFVLGSKYVGNPWGGNYLGIRAAVAHHDGDNAFTVAAEYFLTQGLSIGAGVTAYDDDAIENSYMVESFFYFTHSIFARGYYEEWDNNTYMGLGVGINW